MKDASRTESLYPIFNLYWSVTKFFFIGKMLCGKWDDVLDVVQSSAGKFPVLFGFLFTFSFSTSLNDYMLSKLRKHGDIK